MGKKKQYQAPVVLQQVRLRLEKDLLTGPSAMGAVRTLGIEEESFTTSESWETYMD